MCCIAINDADLTGVQSPAQPGLDIGRPVTAKDDERERRHQHPQERLLQFFHLMIHGVSSRDIRVLIKYRSYLNMAIYSL